MRRVTFYFITFICSFQFVFGTDKKVEEVTTFIEGNNISACESTVGNTTSEHQVESFFLNLFSTEGFPARWVCGVWTDFHGWTYIISDFITFLAYFAIPAILFFFIYRQKSNFPFRTAVIFFVLFIFFCGLTHLIDSIIFWQPLYRLSALLRFFTAVVSVSTVFVLIHNLPRALKFRSPMQLEKEVSIRTSNLNNRNNELEVISHMMSHDMKSPLSNISGITQVLEEKYRTDEETSELLRYLKTAVENSFDKISEVNDLVKVNANNTQHFEEVSLRKEIDDAIENFQYEENILNTSIDISIQKDKVITNKTALKSILQNLVGNSIKYGRNQSKLKIQITQTIDEEGWQLEVNDNGPGIDVEKEKDRLFKLYQRFDNSVEGTGIGLYLVKQHVEKLGGSIEVKSEIGKGARFILVFPLLNGS